MITNSFFLSWPLYVKPSNMMDWAVVMSLMYI